MIRLAHVCLLLVFATASLSTTVAATEAEQKSILITGASSGIGRHLAEALAADGHHVYAGARSDEDMASLNAIDNVTAVRLDVTKQEQIDAALSMIEGSGTGLYALVNNAGIGDGGPVLDTPVAVQRLVYDVNVEGVYRVTKAFGPLVKASKGRIAITGSIAGTLSWPGGSAYAGSKHWIEAFTDALAGEMAPHGVSVSVIEPGNYQTQIRRSALARQQARVLAAGGEMTDEMREAYANTEARELSYKLPDEVTAAFRHALFDESPLLRYMVVPSAEEQAMTIQTKLQQLIQLNQWGPHRYSDEALVALLQQALAAENE
jgi:NAD(P)-dependent dehydrogenase (short-subunit alcohol dehydrogenase family)